MIPGLEAAITRAASQGLREIVVGMAHRGRLNMLTNFMGKSFKEKPWKYKNDKNFQKKNKKTKKHAHLDKPEEKVYDDVEQIN